MRLAKFLASAAALVTFGVTSPSSAAEVVGSCALSDFAGAVACSGFFDGNLLNNKDGHFQDQKDALAALGFTFAGDWKSVDATKIDPKGSVYDFAVPLNGITYIGVHKGNANGRSKTGFSGTAFYKLDATNLDLITFNLSGGSSAVLYSTNAIPAVPEPQIWLMMILGFAGISFAMRRRPKKTAAEALSSPLPAL